MKRKMIWVLALVVFTAITLITLIVFVSIRMNEVHQKMQMARFQTESSCMLMALSNYVNTFGAIPSDTNAAMLSALIGQNSNRMVFLYVKTNRINSFGEYTDL